METFLMLRRRGLWALAVVALLLSVAAAAFAVQAFGGGTRDIVVPSVESGARPHLAAATTAAAAWHEDAYLTRVYATEGKPLEGRVDPPFLYDTSPDPLVGNGLATAWTFAFASPVDQGRLYFVSIGGDGGVLYQRALADPSACCVAYAVTEDGVAHSSYPTMPAPPRLDEPTLDASDAFGRVADRPEFATFAADHPTFQAFLELSPGEEGRPVWNVAYRTATFYSSFARVDATSGEVLNVDSWPRVEPPCCVEPPTPPQPPYDPHLPCCRAEDYHETFRFTLDAARSYDQVSFPVLSAAYLRELLVTVEPEDAVAPLDAVQVRLTDGQGRPLAREASAGPMTFSFNDVAGDGIFSLQAWLSNSPSLREIPVSVSVDVTYDEVARPLAPEHVFRDSVGPMGSESYVSLWFADAHATRLALTWGPTLPVDALELVILDQYGNDVATLRDTTGHAELEVPEGECCLTAVVRNAGRTFSEQPFELLVEVAPYAPQAAVHHVHDHVDHAH